MHDIADPLPPPAPEAARPWLALPPEVAAALRPALPALATEIIGAVRAGVPDYARPIEGPFGTGLRIGVEHALREFVAEIERGEAGPRPSTYVNLGRGEWRAGRTLDALLSAYRLGARIAWHRIVRLGAQAGLAPETMYLVAESIFAYIDELSAESAEGYALEQSAAAGAAELRRRRLVLLLVQEPAADVAAIAAAAEEAGWPLPPRLAALAIAGPERERAAGRLVALAISAPVGETVCALVRDPAAPGRRAELVAALGDGARGALGPAVAWSEAAVSFARARAAIDLGPGPLVVADEHLADLLLAADRRLARDLAAARLAPLAALPAGARARLTATLRAWLARQGRLQATADDLHVHPQTVRYRLERLRELLGDALDYPDGRFELELALRARAAVERPLATGAPSSAPTATISFHA